MTDVRMIDFPELRDGMRDLYKLFSSQDKIARTAAWHVENTRRAEHVRAAGELFNLIIANQASFEAWRESAERASACSTEAP